ncbi:nitrogenase cofactor biosynthesis protein NifB [Treponema primitia ZAS-2]|uniref:Nitrogenase cofactor biosynthesis protein NifB n=1 Tax=Treponema primitia (strain ATCC BAA-887 / DSM 12427 / ZAS-2) TaxID=545694 RepID=F5YPB0_TREPZ|nr:radical SAM protein [Treponema primitia]AEF84549.1 nitrogenase cofactor biosynthesis protein NifB [Treponema primitia ZAS-2]
MISGQETKKDFSNHPCFSSDARHSTGRIHLPVAGKCNVQCNFCNRKYNCVNESRPGVSSALLSPFQALDYLKSVLNIVDNISVIGIAGPGDPFANPEETLATMELVQKNYPDKILCLATNGLALSDYGERLGKLNISHVTITVNAVDPAIGAKIYAWVRYGPHVYRGVTGADLLIQRQTEAIKVLKSLGIIVKINTVVIPGINDAHAAEVAAYTASLGADVQNCIPMMHVEETAFADIPSPTGESMTALRLETGKHLRQMSHCARCRADAAGFLGEENPREIERLLEEAKLLRPTAERPYVAVASMEGLFVNQHLGEATQMWIFGFEEGKLVLKGQRPTPAPGSGDKRWERLADTLEDCIAILVSNCGETPKRILEKQGLAVIAGEGLITDLALPLFQGRSIPKIFTVTPGQCGVGVSCGGKGMGCGA